MEVNSRAGDIIIRFDNQQEAAALLAVLSGQAHLIDPKAAAFGNWMYAWFYEQVRKLGTDYAKETDGIRRPISPPSYVPPRQGIVRSFP